MCVELIPPEGKTAWVVHMSVQGHTVIANDVKRCMKLLSKLCFLSCADVFSIETGSLGWDMLKGSSHESSIFMISFS